MLRGMVSGWHASHQMGGEGAVKDDRDGLEAEEDENFPNRVIQRCLP